MRSPYVVVLVVYTGPVTLRIERQCCTRFVIKRSTVISASLARVEWRDTLVEKMVCCSKYTGKARLDGKTAVVTGSNTGIGKYTALDFVKRGKQVHRPGLCEKR